MNKLKCYTIAGIVFVLIAGTVSHFVYEWSGNQPAVGLFFPVNESVWEHMKLLFFPMLFYTLAVKKRLCSDCPCGASALSAGLLTGTFMIPGLFYIYSGILGRNTLPLDIAVFAVSIAAAFAAVYRLSLSCCARKKERLLKFLVLLLTLCFWLFTYFPPQIGLFATP